MQFINTFKKKKGGQTLPFLYVSTFLRFILIVGMNHLHTYSWQAITDFKKHRGDSHAQLLHIEKGGGGNYSFLLPNTPPVSVACLAAYSARKPAED